MTRHATPADYARLGLPARATPAEIKTAFRRLALQYHPDRNPGNPDAAKQFRSIADSYEALLKGPAPPPPRSGAAPGPRPAARPHGTAPRDHGHSDHERHAPPPPPVYSPTTHRPRKVVLVDQPLAAIPVGDVVWTDYSAILVGPDRACYLDPAAIGRHHVDRGPQVRVERRHDGWRVEIPAHCRHRWSASPRAAQIGLMIDVLTVGDHGGQNALLPARMLDSTVARMAIGQRGWTVAHALVVTQAGRVYVDGSEQVSPAPGLTTPVRVEKRGDGFHVVAPGHPQQWADQGRTATPSHLDVISAHLGGVMVSRAAASA